MRKLLSFAMVLAMATGTAYAESGGKPAARMYTPTPTYEELAQQIDELRARIDLLVPVVDVEVQPPDEDFPWLILIIAEDGEDREKETAQVFHF